MVQNRSSYLMLSGLFLAVGTAVGLLLHFPSSGRADRGPNLPGLSPSERDQQFEALAREVDQFQRQANILKTAVRLVSPTVVHIDAERRDPPGGRVRRGTIEEAGSGVIIEMAGKRYVLTNRHVIKDHGNAEIKIRLYDNHVLTPQKIWQDADTDIALMLVSGDDLVPARIGNSDHVEIGDGVIALGSPFGLSRSVTSGIISAKGRRDLKLGEGVRLQDFLQTDAAINPGNSGGPLINMRGEVIGVNTAIVSNSGGFEGIGFSIPINMAMLVARHLVERGFVTRAFLGVQYDKEFDAAAAARLGLPQPYGARVEGLTEGGPAELARLQVEDVILNFDGVRVDDGEHLVNLVSMTEVGKDVPLIVWRGGREVHLSAKVGDASKFRKKPIVESSR